MSLSGHPELVTLVCCIVAYFVCGIPFGKILAGCMCKIDLQKVGSGNIGTTNALRAGGPKVAALTLLCDVLKGFGCVHIGAQVIALEGLGFDVSAVAPGTAYDYLVALVCLASVLGHMFSPYLHFHGGKSIATGVGVLFSLAWPLALIHLGIFIALVALTGYVSAGSIVTAALVGVTVSFYFPSATVAFKLIMAVLGLLVVWAHRTNIKKLRSGTESKLSFTKRVDRMDDAA